MNGLTMHPICKIHLKIVLKIVSFSLRFFEKEIVLKIVSFSLRFFEKAGKHMHLK